MAKRNSTTDDQWGRNTGGLASLKEIIEIERIRLMKAHSVLGCTSIALDHDDGTDHRHPDYAHVVDVVRDMIQETTVRLDGAYLGRFYERIQPAD